MPREDFLERFTKPELARKLAERLRMSRLKEPVRFMHVCGTHEHSIARSGIRSFLHENISLVAGPGCPVCVCPASDISMALQAARMRGGIVATFGDMFRVPSSDQSLEKLKAEGMDVRIIYSPFDAISIARENPKREVIFMAVGFETTAAPIAAACLSDPPDNLSLIVSIRLIPPALRFLLNRDSGSVNGFILPGHVSTIIGREGYSFLEDEYDIPSVIAGFEAVDILAALLELTGQASDGPPYRVVNLYGRAVRDRGNQRAREMMGRVFEKRDSSWRGIGVIPDSGLFLSNDYRRLDAVSRFGLKPDGEAVDVLPGCICHKVILGDSEPAECPLFGNKCTPASPFGPCMVSSEGTCRARYLYGEKSRRRGGVL